MNRLYTILCHALRGRRRGTKACCFSISRSVVHDWRDKCFEGENESSLIIIFD
jgi:hypothetical protein